MGFGIGIFQHITLSSMLINSVHAKHIREGSAMLRNVIHYRRYITDYVPMLILIAPLCSQMANGNMGFNAAAQRNRNPTTFKSVLKDSGMLASACALQWIAMLVFVVFYASFGCDLFVAAGLSGSEDATAVADALSEF